MQAGSETKAKIQIKQASVPGFSLKLPSSFGVKLVWGDEHTGVTQIHF